MCLNLFCYCASVLDDLSIVVSWILLSSHFLLRSVNVLIFALYIYVRPCFYIQIYIYLSLSIYLTIVSSFWITDFIIMYCPSLADSLVLKSILSDTRKVIQLWFALAQNIFVHSFTFSFCVPSHLNSVPCRQHIDRSFFPHSATLSFDQIMQSTQRY